MSTPEKPRPSLDDTLHDIDEVIAEDEGGRCAIEHVTRDYGGFSRTQCPNQAVPGLYYCQPHTDRYGIHAKPGTAAEFLDLLANERQRMQGKPVDRGGLRTVAEASAELLDRERPPTQPPAIVEPDRGWLARALHRLFG